jgi:DNA polymerase-4
VRVNRVRKSVGGERTFGEDIAAAPALRDTLETIVDIVWDRIERAEAKGRTVTLKLKYNDFILHTRSRTVPHLVEDKGTLATVARELLDAELPLPRPIRLMGLTLSSLQGVEKVTRREQAARTAQLALL